MSSSADMALSLDSGEHITSSPVSPAECGGDEGGGGGWSYTSSPGSLSLSSCSMSKSGGSGDPYNEVLEECTNAMLWSYARREVEGTLRNNHFLSVSKQWESSKHNNYIISPRVIIKAIINISNIAVRSQNMYANEEISYLIEIFLKGTRPCVYTHAHAHAHAHPHSPACTWTPTLAPRTNVFQSWFLEALNPIISSDKFFWSRWELENNVHQGIMISPILWIHSMWETVGQTNVLWAGPKLFNSLIN